MELTFLGAFQTIFEDNKKTPSETDVAAKAISGLNGIEISGWGRAAKGKGSKKFR